MGPRRPETACFRSGPVLPVAGPKSSRQPVTNTECRPGFPRIPSVSSTPPRPPDLPQLGRSPSQHSSVDWRFRPRYSPEMLRVAEFGRRPYSQTVLVADDSPVVRSGLADVINGSPGIVITGLAASAESAIELAG